MPRVMQRNDPELAGLADALERADEVPRLDRSACELRDIYDDCVMCAWCDSVAVVVTKVPLSRSAERALGAGAFRGLYHGLVRSEDESCATGGSRAGTDGPPLPYEEPEGLFVPASDDLAGQVPAQRGEPEDATTG